MRCASRKAASVVNSIGPIRIRSPIRSTSGVTLLPFGVGGQPVRRSRRWVAFGEATSRTTLCMRRVPDMSRTSSTRTQRFPGTPSHRRLPICRDTERPAVPGSQPARRRCPPMWRSRRLSHLCDTVGNDLVAVGILVVGVPSEFVAVGAGILDQLVTVFVIK